MAIQPSANPPRPDIEFEVDSDAIEVDVVVEPTQEDCGKAE